MSKRSLILVLAALAPLAACAGAKDAIRGPQLSAVNYPADPTPDRMDTLESRDLKPRPASANSLWRNGARA